MQNQLEQVQFPKALQQRTQSLTSSSADSKRAAKAIITDILQCYPETGKVQPAYVLGLIELVETYPDHIQRAFADKRTGIAARCKFLPTIADFVTMAGEILAAEDAKTSEQARIADLAARVEARRKMPEPELGKPPVRYMDKHGNWINEREAMESIERAKQDKEAMAKAKRMTDYVRHLGQGDGLKGWQIVMEQGILEPPADWQA